MSSKNTMQIKMQYMRQQRNVPQKHICVLKSNSKADIITWTMARESSSKKTFQNTTVRSRPELPSWKIISRIIKAAWKPALFLTQPPKSYFQT